MTVAMNCVHCGTTFTTTNQEARSGRKYCSHTCYREREKIEPPRKRVTPVDLTCQTCGKIFQRDPGELRAYNKKYGRDPLYCSTECGGVGRRTTSGRTCKVCDKPMPPYESNYGRRRTVCSPECRSAHQSKTMLAYNADRTPVARPAKHGYMRLTVRKNPDEKAVEVLEHRHAMEQKIGRPLRKGETVHHINGVKTDNRIENLELFTGNHGPGQRVTDQIAWAIQLAADYPEFLREAGYELKLIAPA